MKFVLPIVLLFLAGCQLGGCDIFQPEQNIPEPPRTIKLVPDSTLYVVAILEASPDTMHHYTEVFLGRIFDPLDVSFDLIRDVHPLPGHTLWRPMMLTQVIKKCDDLDLLCVPEEQEALVQITGPLGQAEERTATLAYKGNGVYGDQVYTLALVPGGRYILHIELDGATYYAETQIPGLTKWPTPDTLHLPLTLHEIFDGTYYESNEHSDNWQLPYEPPPDGVLTITQYNSELDFDRAINGLRPDERLLFEDRGPYLWDGLQYGITTNALPLPHYLGPIWSVSSNMKLRTQLWAHFRISQLNDVLARYYVEELSWITIHPDDTWRASAESIVVEERDTTYFPSISNIHLLDDQGHPLPVEQSGVVGIFASYSSIYRKMLLIPERSWDPDTLDWKR